MNTVKRARSAVLVALGAGTATALTLQPVFIPSPTGANEIHKQGTYFGHPPDSVTVVTANVDQGAAFSCPTDYPPQRHTAHSFSTDAYHTVYEWNEQGGWMIGAKSWVEIGAPMYWSLETTPSETEYQTGAGCPSLLGTETGVAIAYHAGTAESDLQVYFNTLESYAEWGESLLLDGSIPSTRFPFLDRSSDGTYMVVCDKGSSANPTCDVTTFISADGLTWTESVVQVDVVANWTLPSGASDPTNGDLYVAYSDDIDDDGHADIAIHRSTNGGLAWSSQQMVVSGGPGDQCTFPSLVVGRDHVVHLLYQHNIADDYSSGGLAGLDQLGPSGPPSYVVGSFTGPDTWTTTSDESLLARDDLVALPDSCGLNPTLATIATDTLTGMPQLSIRHGQSEDWLWAAYNNSYMAVTAEGGGWSVCGPMQTWYQHSPVNIYHDWQERGMVSNITVEQAQEGCNAMYAGLTHDVFAMGPGLVWSENYDATAPSDVMYRCLDCWVGIEGDQPGALARPQSTRLHPAYPNPFNPMTQISYQLDAPADVALRIYDAAGRCVRTLDGGPRAAGMHQVCWDGTNERGQSVATGVYFYRLTADGLVATRSMLLLK